MVGMPGQDRDAAVELLQKHDANELVRPGRRTEGNDKARLFTQAGRQPIGRADGEHDRGLAPPSPFLQPRSKGGAAHGFSAFIQDHGDRAIGDHIGNCNRFFEHAPGSVAGAALFDFDDIDGAQSEFAAGIERALAIAFGELALGTLLQTTDGSDHDAHA